MDIGILRDTLRGGLDKMREAGVLLVGGHSVEDHELKYGLSVNGVVHPGRVLLNHGAQAGDFLILTKAIGTGIISTALKGGVADPELVARAVVGMTKLNRDAALLMQDAAVHACTDITGFGLLGHAAEMINGSNVGMEIFSRAVPVFPGVRDLAESGILPAGLYRNREFRERQVDFSPECPEWLADVLFDPQTAGGLLIALPEKESTTLLKKMHAGGIPEAAIIGKVVEKPNGRIQVL
jgi:selenide,water dikinase